MRAFPMFCLILILLGCHLATAATNSPSDKLCFFLGSVATDATRADQVTSAKITKSFDAKMNDLMEITLAVQKLERPMRAAVAKRLTFEQFQDSLGPDHRLNAYYKSLYVGRYLKTYCGEVKDRADFSLAQGKITDPRGEVTFARQFDVREHAYFQQMTTVSADASR